MATIAPATQPQVKYINVLIGQREVPADFLARLTERLDEGTVDKALASETITWLKRRPVTKSELVAGKAEVTVPATPAVVQGPLCPGVYVLPDGKLVKLVLNKTKTALSARFWENFHGERLTLVGEKVKARWVYVVGSKAVIAGISPEMKMTKDQAKQFTTVYGVCCNCGRKLEAAESVEKGIGPVCIKKFA